MNDVTHMFHSITIRRTETGGFELSLDRADKYGYSGGPLPIEDLGSVTIEISTDNYDDPEDGSPTYTVSGSNRGGPGVDIYDSAAAKASEAGTVELKKRADGTFSYGEEGCLFGEMSVEEAKEIDANNQGPIHNWRDAAAVAIVELLDKEAEANA